MKASGRVKLTPFLLAYQLTIGEDNSKSSFYSVNILFFRKEDTIIRNLKQIGINTGNWVDSAQERDCWRALVNLRVP